MTTHAPTHALLNADTHPRIPETPTPRPEHAGHGTHAATHATHAPEPPTLTPLSLWRGRAGDEPGEDEQANRSGRVAPPMCGIAAHAHDGSPRTVGRAPTLRPQAISPQVRGASSDPRSDVHSVRSAHLLTGWAPGGGMTPGRGYLLRLSADGLPAGGLLLADLDEVAEGQARHQGEGLFDDGPHAGQPAVSPLELALFGTGGAP